MRDHFVGASLVARATSQSIQCVSLVLLPSSVPQHEQQICQVERPCPSYPKETSSRRYNIDYPDVSHLTHYLFSDRERYRRTIVNLQRPSFRRRFSSFLPLLVEEAKGASQQLMALHQVGPIRHRTFPIPLLTRTRQASSRSCCKARTSSRISPRSQSGHIFARIRRDHHVRPCLYLDRCLQPRHSRSFVYVLAWTLVPYRMWKSEHLA